MLLLHLGRHQRIKKKKGAYYKESEREIEREGERGRREREAQQHIYPSTHQSKYHRHIYYTYIELFVSEGEFLGVAILFKAT